MRPKAMVTRDLRVGLVGDFVPCISLVYHRVFDESKWT